MKETLGKEFYESADKAITISRPETLEEAAKNYICKPQNNDYGDYNSFIEGAKWQQERSYSEEEVISLLIKREYALDLYDMANDYEDAVKWFEQFKKK